MRVGSILGRHAVTRELYAVHRNQKTYLVFRNDHHKWIAIIKKNFADVSKDIDYRAFAKLEEDNEQVFIFGLDEWMGKFLYEE